MENASKALLIAGGILVALLIIGGLLLMFNTIGDYQRSQDTNKKTTQLAEFNLDFERYADDKGIKGADIISLINKIIDYNYKARNGGVTNSVDYSIKMSITVSGLDDFNKKYAYESGNNALFNQPSSTFGENGASSNTIKKTLEDCIKAENIVGNTDKLKILSSVYDTGKDNVTNEKNIKAKCDEIGFNWDKNTISLDTIKKYRQYSEFKSSTFKIDKTQEDEGVVYKNGQIQKFYFKFVK